MQNDVVSPNSLSCMLFAHDPPEAIRKQISVTKPSEILTRLYKGPKYTLSMNSALGHGAFEEIEKRIKPSNMSGVFWKDGKEEK